MNCLRSSVLILALFQPPDVSSLIDDLGNARWSVRHQATLRLYELLDDVEVFRQIRESLLTDAELSPESRVRHQRLLSEYYLKASPLYAETLVGGKKMRLPSAFIWSLPREYRFTDDVDVAADCYRRALDDLQRFGVLFDAEIYNHEAVMRHATHLFIVDWLNNYQTHDDLAALHAAMLESQDADEVKLTEYLQSIGYRGKWEWRTVPPAIEDRTGADCVTRQSRVFHFQTVTGDDA